jgi:hypothetical protein
MSDSDRNVRILKISFLAVLASKIGGNISKLKMIEAYYLANIVVCSIKEIDQSNDFKVENPSGRDSAET